MSPTVFDDRDELAQRAAAFVAGALRAGVADRGRAALVLAGGSTPEPVYRLLADTQHDAPFWPHVHVFFGDERCVPPDHPQSNYRLARRTLLDALPIEPAHVHRLPGELHPPTAAYDYDDLLRDYGDLPSDDTAAEFNGAGLSGALLGGARLFDVTLLGLGEDGHTASLFPGSPALDETARLCVHTTAPPSSPVADRLTLTFPALAASERVLFLVAGEGKRAALRAALDGQPLAGQVAPVPASRVTAQGEVLWFVDRAAAGD